MTYLSTLFAELAHILLRLLHQQPNKERTMEHPKLTPERAEAIINLLRDNPGVGMPLSTIADETGLPVEDLAAYLEDLAARTMVLK